MGSTTKISWTDMTFNPWIGCRKVAEECKNCYAETLDRNRFSKTLPGCSKEKPISHWGSGPRYRTSLSNWREPLKWNKKAAEAVEDAMHDFGEDRYIAPQRPRVFCASLSDWLDDENVPIEWLADLLKLIHDTPNLDWLLLTKRPQNFATRLRAVIAAMPEEWDGDDCPAWAYWVDQWVSCEEPPANVWIGVSAGADQAAALQIPARIHFLSCEPMLRPMDTTHAARFDWIIWGGESGKNSRECHIDWLRNGVAFARHAGVVPFIKQLGSNCAMGWDYLKLKDSHGADMSEWPEDLRVREFPTAK